MRLAVELSNGVDKEGRNCAPRSALLTSGNFLFAAARLFSRRCFYERDVKFDSFRRAMSWTRISCVRAKKKMIFFDKLDWATLRADRKPNVR